MSLTSSRRARVAAVMDRQWGEEFTLTPRRQPPGDRDARYELDPSRQPFDLIGRYLSAGDDVHARDRNVSQQMTRPVAGSLPTVTVAKSSLRFEIVEGDLILRKETGATFVVSNPQDGQFERVVLKLRTGS